MRVEVSIERCSACFWVADQFIGHLYWKTLGPIPPEIVAMLFLNEDRKLHRIRADGSCDSCTQWHGWLIDLALEAGWQCPALDAAVAARAAEGP